MLQVLFTLDYEIHGNGQGSPARLMVEPTARMLRQFDRHGAKLTVMADIAEILRFRRHARDTGRDEFFYREIEDQLQSAVRTGHDVQFHVHPSYLNATRGEDGWRQDYSEYDVARLDFDRIDEIVKTGKSYLEDLLQPVDPSYRCVAFRAANWSMHPSPNIVRALVRNGIRIDSSVFKGGRREGIVQFDYRHAHSAIIPWRVDPEDVCRPKTDGDLIEIPIYSESRHLHHFASANRVYRAVQQRLHPLPGEGLAHAGDGQQASSSTRLRRALAVLTSRHAWKLDFNQCSGRQLIAGLERVSKRYDAPDQTLPVVLIGHSKTYTKLNERLLEPFLEHVAARPDRFQFATFRDTLDTSTNLAP
jgi:hypothetical protein